MEAFARAWHEENRGKWLEVDYLGGFCLLIKRQLLDQIGPLEAKAGLNIFDTDSLCLKLRKAGYLLACCKDLFIQQFRQPRLAPRPARTRSPHARTPNLNRAPWY